MPDDASETFKHVATLPMIKSHLDSHGVACAIVNDHIAIGVAGGPGAPGEKVLRVKSFDEACDAIGCACRCHHEE